MDSINLLLRPTEWTYQGRVCSIRDLPDLALINAWRCSLEAAAQDIASQIVARHRTLGPPSPERLVNERRLTRLLDSTPREHALTDPTHRAILREMRRRQWPTPPGRPSLPRTAKQPTVRLRRDMVRQGLPAAAEKSEPAIAHGD